jgi:hypothetical protein
MKKTVKTTWELWDYEVWGNNKDGYDANDRFCFNREYEINLKIEDNNPNTPQQFYSAYPSDYQIKKAFGIGCRISLEGDDTTIYVNREYDDYPIGEMFLTSHKSLSPINPL